MLGREGSRGPQSETLLEGGREKIAKEKKVRRSNGEEGINS